MKKQYTKGAVVLELLIATGLFAIVLSGIILVAFGGQTSALDIGLTNEGTYRTGSAKENAASAAAGSWNTFTAGTSNAGSDATYSMLQTVTDISPCAKFVSNNSDWDSEHNRTQNEFLQQIVVNTTIAKAMGGVCSATPPTEWDNPGTYTGVNIPSVPGSDIAAENLGGKRVAVIAANASSAGKDDLWVYNVSDPIGNPAPLLESKNTGKGLNSVAVAGIYAYAVQNDVTNQLQVIQMVDTTKAPSNPAYWTPTVLASVPLYDSVAVAGNSIAYYNNRVYIGTKKNTATATSTEFFIYDVSTPASPVYKGRLNLDQDVNEIVVSGTYAYLATSHDTKELTVVDVSNPSSPSIAGSYDAPASTKDGTAIAVVGNRAYLGRQKGTSAADKDFIVLNISTPSTPTLIGGINLNMNGASAAVEGIVVQASYAFIGTSDTNDEFRVLDVSGSTPVQHGCAPYNYSASVSALAFFDNYIFAANGSNDAFRVIYDKAGTTCS